jgi:hypothetical protein
MGEGLFPGTVFSAVSTLPACYFNALSNAGFHGHARCSSHAAVDTVIGVKRQSGLRDDFWLFQSLA